jgi:hypothetical protein
VLQGEAGWSPVWLNDQTVATVVDINPTTERLVLLDVPTGKRRPVGGDLAPGRLLADGHGRLAHWHVLDWGRAPCSIQLTAT